MNDEFGPNFVTLTDDEGNDIELEYVDALEHNGTTENGEEFLVTIDDEEEIDKVYDLFMEQILSDEE